MLATGGFQGDPELVERYVRPAAPLRVRANPWSAGDGLRDRARARRRALAPAWTSSTAATWPTSTSTSPASSRSRRSTAATPASSTSAGRSSSTTRPSRWSELDLVQATAHQPGARAWYLLDDGPSTSASGTAPSASWSPPRRREPTRPSCLSSRRPEPSPPFGSRPRSRTRSAASAWTSRPGSLDEAARADRRPLRRGCRRRRDLDRRLRERPGLGARARPSGRRDRAQLTGCR